MYARIKCWNVTAKKKCFFLVRHHLHLKHENKIKKINI